MVEKVQVERGAVQRVAGAWSATGAREALASALASGGGLREVRDRDLAVAALITQVVAFSTGVDAEEIAAGGRTRSDAARARQIAMYLAHTALSWPLWRVGQAFGRDRTTAGHACGIVEELRDDRLFDTRMEALEACLKAAPPSAGLPLS